MTDHVKNQLCARIEELEKEKLELNEQLDVAQRGLDALEAHVERLLGCLVVDEDGAEIKRVSDLREVVSRTPTTTLTRLKAQWQAEEDRLDWLEQQARKSRTGISFDWVPICEGEPSGFRFMRRHFIGEPAKTLRDAIDRVMRAEEGET